MGLQEILDHITCLSDRIAELQNEDGGFDTMFLQPCYNSDKGWMKFGSSTFDAAVVGIAIMQMNSQRSKLILESVERFIVQNSFYGKLWAYTSLNESYPHYFDTDSTAMCSFFLEKLGRDTGNRHLVQQLTNGNDYPVFVGSDRILRGVSIWFQFKLALHNLRVRRGLAYQNNLMRLSDVDFVVTCNNLLFLGEEYWDYRVVDRVKNDFYNMRFELMYYPNPMMAVYTFARLCFYRDLVLEWNRSELISHVKKNYYQCLDDDRQLTHLLFGCSILYMNVDFTLFPKELNDCLGYVRSANYPVLGLYSGNLKTDLQPDGKSPNTYFGSEALTCALHLEFLNLLKLRNYGSS